jgi:hypothetical protein
MKYFFVFAALIIASFCYSQSNVIVSNIEGDFKNSVQNSNKIDSALSEIISLNTPAVFSITFYDGNKKALISSNKYTSYDEICLDKIENGYLSFRKKYPYKDHPNAITTSRRIALKDIKSLGYSTNSKETFGALLGMGIGALGGAIITAIGNSWGNSDDAFNVTSPNWDNSNSAVNTGSEKKYSTPIIVWALSGAALGYLIGGTTNSYENYDLKKFDNDDAGKINEIKKVITKGLNYRRKQ